MLTEVMMAVKAGREIHVIPQLVYSFVFFLIDGEAFPGIDVVLLVQAV